MAGKSYETVDTPPISPFTQNASSPDPTPPDSHIDNENPRTTRKRSKKSNTKALQAGKRRKAIEVVGGDDSQASYHFPERRSQYTQGGTTVGFVNYEDPREDELVRPKSTVVAVAIETTATQLTQAPSIISTLSELDSEQVPAPTELQRANNDSVKLHSQPAKDPIPFDYSWVDFTKKELSGYTIPLSAVYKLEAWVWKYGVPLEKRNKETKSRYWLCRLCVEEGLSRRPYDVVSSVSSTKKHLGGCHQLFETLGSSPDAAADIQLDSSSSEGVRVINALAGTFDAHKFQGLLMRWIVKEDIAFRKLDTQELKDIFVYLNKRTEEGGVIPHSTTMRRHIVLEFRRQKHLIISHLAKAASKVHLAFDLWTSPNYCGFNGVVAHYIDNTGHQIALLLSLVEMNSSHTGVNIAESLWRVISEYQIVDSLGYIISDNASNNWTALVALADIYRKAGKKFNPNRKYVRCMGHICNLIANAILYTDADAEAASATEEDGHDDPSLEPPQGVIRKLRSLVKYINASPQRRARFEVAQRRVADAQGSRPAIKQLLLSNATRWNSTYAMIVRARELAEALDDFLLMEEQDLRKASSQRNKQASQGSSQNQSPAKDLLSLGLAIPEWEVLHTITELLSPIYEVTLRLQGLSGKYNNISWSYHSLSFILAELEAWVGKLTELPGKEELLACAQAGWEKASYYYKELNDNPAYTAAIVLDPTRKMEYIKVNWIDESKHWVTSAETWVKKLWESEYKVMTPARPGTTTTTTPAPRTPKVASKLDLFTRESLQKVSAIPSEKSDQLEDYLARPVELGEVELIKYWMREDIRARWPQLSKMAIDILSVVPMSDAPERAFSEAKILITDRRNRLKSEIIEAHECCSSWDRAGVIKIGTYIGAVPQIDEEVDEGSDEDGPD